MVAVRKGVHTKSSRAAIHVVLCAPAKRYIPAGASQSHVRTTRKESDIMAQLLGDLAPKQVADGNAQYRIATAGRERALAALLGGDSRAHSRDDETQRIRFVRGQTPPPHPVFIHTRDPHPRYLFISLQPCACVCVYACTCVHVRACVIGA